MFNFSSINRTTVWYVIILLTTISFSWHERLNSIGVILLIIHWLWDKNLLKKVQSFYKLFTLKHSPAEIVNGHQVALNSSVHIQSLRRMPYALRLSTWLLWAFFCLHLIGLLWSHLQLEGLQSIEVKLTFLILPILFITENYINEKRVNQLFFLFIISSCFSFCVSFIHSYTTYLHLGWSAVLSRMNISEGIMHPGYYSNYFVYMLVWCVFQLIENKGLSQLRRVTLFCLMPFLLIVLLLLISKTAILYLGFFSMYLIWRLTAKVSNMTARVGLFSLTICLFIAASSQIGPIKKRIIETTMGKSQVNKEVGLENSTASRIIAWQNEWKLIKESYVIGYGTGEANPQLKSRLFKEGYINLATDNMHTHNQIFHTWLNVGIAGVFILLAILVVCGFVFYRQKNKLALWLIPLIFINTLTDDMLEIQAGAVFFIFFLTLFLYQRQETKDLDKREFES